MENEHGRHADCLKMTLPIVSVGSPVLAGQPAELVSRLGGPFGDISHDEASHARASRLAVESGAMFGALTMRFPGCFRWHWRDVWAIILDGQLRLYADSKASKPMRTLTVQDCACEVGERDDCRENLYCFRLRHASGYATFCAFDSKSHLLWLQALQTSGVRYEDPPADVGNVTSLFKLSALNLAGEAVGFERYDGCVCLVVNGASK